MKRILLTLTVTICCIFTCAAQLPKGIFSIGVEGGAPVGRYADLYEFGFGATLKYEVPATPNIFISVMAGYMSYPIKEGAQDDLQELGRTQTSSGYIPLKMGAKFSSGPGFFFEAQVGAAIGTAKGYGTAFAYSPGIGVDLKGGLEFGFRYEVWKKSGIDPMGQLGFRIAYLFK